MKEKIYRKDKIIELCRNKTVLHLGFIQHSHLYQNLIKEGKWLHQKIAQVSSSLVGFDYLEKDVDYIRDNLKYECYFADVTDLETLSYQKTFDVVVCGELIEHISNPGLMLEGIKRFMHKDSILIITTPSPWSKNRLNLIKRKHYELEWLNPEHICWFSFQTLKQILDRYGYSELSYNYYFGEQNNERNSLFNSRILNGLKTLKDQIFVTPEVYYTGLFFITKLKE